MSSTARWTLAVVLLAPAVVLPLLVCIYDRETPELWGFPFYYWFQFALIPVAAALTTSAYLLVRAHEPDESSATTPRTASADSARTDREADR